MRRKGKRVTYGDFSAEENEQMRLYNLTMKINRLELLKSKLGLTTVDGYSELRNYMGDKLNGAVIAESKRQAGILGEYSGVLQMDPKKAAAIVNGSFKGATFSQRLWKNQQELKQTLDAGLTSALIRGKSSAEVASLIRKHFTGDFQKAGKASLRLAVTEMARVEIEVQKNSFEKNGFEEYTFNATGPHPCDICQALDGKHFKVSEMMPGENAPPMHPWCYCAVSAYSDRKEYDEWLNSGAAANGVSLKEFTQKKYGWNKNGLDEFIPAKTIEEAEQYAKQFIGDGYSPTFKNQSLYKGISLENANEINKAIHDLYSKINMPKLAGIKAISPTSKQGKKVFSSSDAVAAYNPVEHGIFLNKDVLKNAKAIQKYNEEANNAWETVMKNINNLSGVQKEIALRYKKAGRALVGDGSVYDYIVHEIGHHVEWSVLDTQTNNIVGKNMSKYAPHISG